MNDRIHLKSRYNGSMKNGTDRETEMLATIRNLL